jgi:hypothetical protein
MVSVLIRLKEHAYFIRFDGLVFNLFNYIFRQHISNVIICCGILAFEWVKYEKSMC